MKRFFTQIASHLKYMTIKREPLSRDGKCLAFSIESNNTDLFRLAFRHTIDCYYHEKDMVEPSLYNACFVAAKLGRIDMLKNLLTQKQYKLSGDVRDEDGNTLISIAEANGHPQVAVLLADLDNKNQEGNNSTLNTPF